MVPIRLLVEPDQRAALQQIKDRTGVGINEQIRRLVDRWILENKEAESANS